MEPRCKRRLHFLLLVVVTSLVPSHALSVRMSSSPTITDVSWSTLRSASMGTAVGAALQKDADERTVGRGSPHVDNKLRLFDKLASYKPKFTLYRDRAGWCPYCEKTILLVEEKRIPIKIETVAMRSYGDKPREFLQMVPSGLLPALIVEEGGNMQVVTESQVIMELLDAAHPTSEGYRAMLPDKSDKLGWAKYKTLAMLERELFSRWCNLVFRPEGAPSRGAFGGVLKTVMGAGDSGSSEEMSPAMRGFVQCLDKVDLALRETPGPWFFDSPEGPTMIDLIFVSHIERMLASVAYWKGLQIRGTGRWKGIDAWFDAFDERPSYLGFKSDFYTNVMDIPPQYGPGYDGGFEEERKKFQADIRGRDGSSWKLPLNHDCTLEPLYKGPPLPLCALEAVGIIDYSNADASIMAKACRHAAGWKLACNGNNVAKFAARGGSKGATNPRKSFAAPLADPYADPDQAALPSVDRALRMVCSSLLLDATHVGEEPTTELNSIMRELSQAVPDEVRDDVVASLAYLRDRVGVPRDMPLAAARHLRAHLNLALDALT